MLTLENMVESEKKNDEKKRLKTYYLVKWRSNN